MTLTRRRIPHHLDETGQTLTEYSLVIALIAVVVAVAIPAVASSVLGIFQAAAAAFGG